ncbi:MAG: ZIP family metal transporter, partial [Dehalococcoidia bacterium]
MPEWLQAWLWGAVAGSALLVGAAAGCLAPMPRRVIAAITSFGGGVLIAVLAFDLMEEAYEQAGYTATAIGFLGGGIAFTVASLYLARVAAARAHAAAAQPSGGRRPGGGVVIAVGSLLDSIPESVVIGLSLIEGGAVSWVTVVGITISNIPEGLTSADSMQQNGRSRRFIFGVWGSIAVVTSLASLAGYSIFGNFPLDVNAAVATVAAGAVLAMLATTMLPEAFAGVRHV